LVAVVALGAIPISVWLISAPGSRGAGARIDESTLATGDRLVALDRDHARVSFLRLSSFVMPETRPSGGQAAELALVPAAIRAFNGRKVAIDGFMLPLDFDAGSVGEFMLNASFDMCQYGAPSLPTERIEVTMRDGRRAPMTHRALRVFGVLTVAPRYEWGKLVGLYRIVAEAIGPPGLGY
jgi:hypothetical protein